MGKRNTEYEFSRSTRERVKFRADYKCEVCGQRHPLFVHHIIPVDFALRYNLPREVIRSDRNAQALCENCHKQADFEQIQNWNSLPQLASKLLGIRFAY